MTALHQGHRRRLLERFKQDGLAGFEPHQVLELLLFHTVPRVDTNPIAHGLLKRFGSLSAVFEADPQDLMTQNGVGERSAAFLALIPQLTRYYFSDRIQREKPKLDTLDAVIEYLVPMMVGRCREVFYVICLDVQCRVLFPALISEGTVMSAHVHPRLVVEVALRHHAASLILAHNHPGGTIQPSRDDLNMTKHLVYTLGALDIAVLDHVIVANDQAYSFARENCLPRFEGFGI